MMENVVVFGIMIGALITGMAIGARIESGLLTIDVQQIEKASEICTNANSKISKISATSVGCQNGGEFKYER